MTTERILLFNVNWLGDVLFSTAVIRSIRRNFPSSFFACIVPSRCYSLLKDNPHLDEIIVYDEKDRHKGIIAKLKFFGYLKAKRFDTVFLLHRSFSRALICFLAGIGQRIGYYTRKRGFLLTRKITSLDPNSLHRIDYYLNVIEKAGLKVEDRYPEFFFGEEDSRFADNFLARNPIGEKDFAVGINPGGNWLPKRWPKEYWAALSDRLAIESGAKVIITGSHADMPLAEEIKRLMQARPVVAAGLLNLKQLGALCRKLDLFITADSGPLHIANAAGCAKIIALFGPTSPQVTGPYPLKNVVLLQKATGCRIPCYALGCKDNRCMRAITVQDVFNEAIRIIPRKQ